MTGNEFIWCTFGFMIATACTYFLFKRFKLIHSYKFLIFVPGFIVANIISFIVSEPLIQYITDQPIIYGFPISFFQLTAWTGYQFSPLLFMLNLILLCFISFFVGKRL